MSLETATFIDQLDGAQPQPTDLKSQGDDHLRLIKNVLKNSIKRVVRAFYVPSTVFKVGPLTYNVLASDDNVTFVCNTIGGDITLNLPTLTPTDAGWCCYVQKNTVDANAVFLVPPSGTINTYTKIRRSAEHFITKVVWNGATFEASRPGGSPIGSCIEFYGSTLPNGYLWPDGGSFSAASYVELNVVLSGTTKPDKRGRVGVGRDDMGGAAANRVTTAGSGINGVALGASGGAQNVALVVGELPAHAHPGSTTDTTHTHPVKRSNSTSGGGPGITYMDGTGSAGTANTDSAGSASNPVSVASQGSGTAHQNMPPTLIANFILVAE